MADLKSQARIDINDEDDLLQDYLEAAIAYCENHCRRAFITQTWQLTIDDFSAERIYLTPAPLQSVSSITYYDSAGSQQNLSSSVYQVVTEHTPPYIRLAQNQSWPSIDDRDAGIVITYVTGYGDAASDLDARIPQMIRFLATHWFLNREPVGKSMSNIPFTVQALLQQFEIGEFY